MFGGVTQSYGVLRSDEPGNVTLRVGLSRWAMLRSVVFCLVALSRVAVGSDPIRSVRQSSVGQG
jgi:hypothetical protein